MLSGSDPGAGVAGRVGQGSRLRSVSIVVPCRNERDRIGSCLDSLLASDFPKDRLEVLVVDGMSEDGTRDIVLGYAERNACVRLVDNPRKVTPCAMNAGIRASSGDVVIIMGAHSIYPAHYVSKCIEHLERTGADVVGGPLITLPGRDSAMARAIALATSHPFGVGNSKFRTSSRDGWTDTVPFGAYRGALFDQVGLFDERLVRHQDNELCSRIIRSGRRIYLASDLAVQYYNQPDLRGLIVQAFRNGMWHVATLRINPSAFRWRHFIPFLFVLGLSLLAASAPFWREARATLAAVAALYGLAALVSSVQVGLRGVWRDCWLLPMVFLPYHVAYGLGTCAGILRGSRSTDVPSSRPARLGHRLDGKELRR